MPFCIQSFPREVSATWTAQGSLEKGLVSFSGGSYAKPGTPKQSSTAIPDALTFLSVPVAFEVVKAVFQADGFKSFTKENFEFLSGTTVPDYDLAVYKTRTSTGSMLHGIDGPLQRFTYETVNHSWEIVDGIWKFTRTVANPDTVRSYDDGGDEIDPFCDYTLYVGYFDTPDYFQQPPWPSSSFGSFWIADTSTTAHINTLLDSVCDSSDATVTLSDPVTWADLETAAARTVAEGYGNPSYSNGPNFWDGTESVAHNTGSGSSDGTKDMRKVVGKYRIHPNTHKRRVVWSEVTRRIKSGGRIWPMVSETVVPRVTKRTTELSSIQPKPFFDEFGNWSIAETGIDTVSEKQLQWNPTIEEFYLTLSGLGWGATSDFGSAYPLAPNPVWERGEGSLETPVVFITRVRVFSENVPDTYRARLTVVDTTVVDPETGEPPTVQVLLVFTGGVTPYYERTLEEGLESHVWVLQSVEILLPVDDEVISTPFKVLYKHRRIMQVGGFKDFDSPSTYYGSTYYSEKTETTEWGMDYSVSNGTDYSTGKKFEESVTGTAKLVTKKFFDLGTGKPWDAGRYPQGEIVEVTGSFNGLAWRPRKHDDSTGLYVSATKLEVTTALTPEFKSPRPFDSNGILDMITSDSEVDSSYVGEVLTTTVKTEIIESGAYGEWHHANCAIRGAAVFLEDYVSYIVPDPA